jgi:hypothetical protein
MALAYLAVLALFAWLMITRRLAATLALPLGALALAAVAVAPTAVSAGAAQALAALVHDVLDPGVTRLSNAIFAVLLGAILAAQLRISGAAERLVRYAAEYAGEDRFRLGLLFLIVTALLFTTLGGLGAVILVATIVLPLMFSLGFTPRAAGGLFLLGLSLGGCLNPVNWQLYIDVLHLRQNQIIPFALTLAGMFFLVSCAYVLAVTADRRSVVRNVLALAVILILVAAAAVLLFRVPAVAHVFGQVLDVAMLALLALLTALLGVRLALQALLRAAARGWLNASDNWLASASVLVPLLLLLWSNVRGGSGANAAAPLIPILTALLAGIAFCALASYTRAAGANSTMRALFEGIGQAAPAVVLLIGIGLLLQATSLPHVVASFSPWLARLPVSTPWGFLATFFVLSPLALYRGPLNLYGMGSGVVGIISAAGVLSPPLIMTAFFSVGMLQGVCDPTNTHNVWVASFCRVPVGELTRVTIPWVLAVVLLGLAAGAAMYSAGFVPGVV